VLSSRGHGSDSREAVVSTLLILRQQHTDTPSTTEVLLNSLSKPAAKLFKIHSAES